ncbi:class I SAM-dependent methyltransferase [Phenylobacterium sp.]|uniref:class I SAM-dependent methyltransferase n=1 Tax=Phenylobacterium sp. TaxID=1871053 RepID=UPI002F946DAF
MTTRRFTGTDGYAQEAAAAFDRYDALPFEHVHRAALHLFPERPSRVLDIGAGTGRDAGWWVARGARVVAAEPTDELREPARLRHPSPAITWLGDGLAELSAVHALQLTFELVMCTGVWMHLDQAERRRAMRATAPLLGPAGQLSISLRHGPVPEGRRMFEVTGAETRALAAEHGLNCRLEVDQESIQPSNRNAGVTWTYLLFERSCQRASQPPSTGTTAPCM